MWRINIFIVLSVMWFCFSGLFDKFLLCCGFVSVLLSILILKYLDFLPRIYLSVVGISYTIKILYDIFASGIKLTKIIWNEKITIESIIGIVVFKDLSNITTTMHANAITMTPGTIVIGVNDNKMLVHFFDKNDYSEVPNEQISNIIDKK
jgi:multicomponent Na+:H+ antiporter subunit E